MSELPYDLQHETADTEIEVPESERSRLLMSGFIALLLFVFLGLILLMLYRSVDTNHRISTIEALPLSELEGYTIFSDETTTATNGLKIRIDTIEKSLVISEGRLDQVQNTSDQISIGLNNSRARMDALEQRLITLANTLEKQQKSAANLQKKMAQSHTSSTTAPAVQLFSVRSFGNVTAVRLASNGGTISPLMKSGDEWNGWRFIRIDGDKAIFSTRGKERALVL